MAALILGAGLLLGLTGCDLYQPDVDSMLAPPVLSELQTEVNEALQDVVGQDFRLCYPTGGGYRSPYIFADLDGDENDEAVVFYTVEDEPLIYLQILDKTEGRWRAGNALPGTDGKVLYVDFRHLSDDGVTDLLVGWRSADAESDTLSLYRFRDWTLSEEFHVSCDGMAIADFNDDGVEELITATLDGGVTLQLIGRGSSGISVLDSAYSLLRLQSLLGSVAGKIAPQQPGAAFYGRVNADMTASLLVGVDGSTLLLPQESEASGYSGSYCYSGAVPADINKDGVVEFPWSAIAAVTADSAHEETRYFTEYRTLLGSGYQTVAVCYQNTADGWQLILPDVLRDAYSMGLLSLRWRAETREIAFIRTLIMVGDNHDELLRLRVVSSADGDAPEGYTLLASRGQFSYYAALPSGSPLTIAEVAESFSLLG